MAWHVAPTPPAVDPMAAFGVMRRMTGSALLRKRRWQLPAPATDHAPPVILSWRPALAITNTRPEPNRFTTAAYTGLMWTPEVKLAETESTRGASLSTTAAQACGSI